MAGTGELHGRSKEQPVKAASFAIDKIKQGRHNLRKTSLLNPAGNEWPPRLSTGKAKRSQSEGSAAVLKGYANLGFQRPGSKSAKSSPTFAKEQTPSKANKAETDNAAPLAKATGIKKFRRVARMVASQLNWTRDLGREAEEHMKTFNAPETGQEGEDLSFNVAHFKRNVYPNIGMSQRVKALLKKNSWARSPSELADIFSVVNQLKYFVRYSSHVKRDLAKIVMFESFGPGRVVVRQGDAGHSFYIILKGQVLVEVREEGGEEPCNSVIGELGSGESFGEQALMSEHARRAATVVVCKGGVELLRVDKPDFDTILRLNHENEWKARTEFFSQQPAFESWTEPQLFHLTSTSVIEEFLPRQVIKVGLGDPKDETIYFILRGRCKVVQVTHTRDDLSAGLPSNGAPRRQRKAPANPSSQAVPSLPTTTTTTTTTATTTTRWWQLRMLTAGDYFGVGEGVASMSVVADMRTECIRVHRFVLLRYDRGLALVQLRRAASRHYPSLEASRPRFAEHLQWRRYRQGVAGEAARRNRKSHATGLRDVPRILLLECPRPRPQPSLARRRAALPRWK